MKNPFPLNVLISKPLFCSKEQIMTRPLDGVALPAYFRRLGLGPDAQELLNRVRSSPPHRTPGSRTGNMPVWYPSTKMQCIIKAESAKVEFAFLLEAEHSDDVLEFFDQPPPIPLEYRDRRNHVQRPLHTADYFVFRSHSAGYEECKPIEKLIQLAQTHPNRYVLDDRGQWRCPPGEAFAAKYGLTYRVRASDQINWAAQENWLYLEDYHNDLDKLRIVDADLATLSQIVDEHPGITLADLRLAASPISSDQINIAIVRQVLYIDLTTHRLTEPGRALVFPSREIARAYRHRSGQVEDLGVEAHPVEIVQGSTILWDGRPWRLHLGQKDITLISEACDPFSLSRSAFELLVKEGKIVGVQAETRSSITPEGVALLENTRPTDLAVAQFRNRVIHPEQYQDDEQTRVVVQGETIPARTKRDWKRWYRDAEMTYGSGLIGLLPGTGRCGGKRKIAVSVIELIEHVLETHYDTVVRKPKRGAYGEYLKQSQEKGLPTISQRTFYAQAQRHKTIYEQTLAREGARAAYPFKEYHHPDQRTIHPHGTYAWAMAHIDHLEVDLQLCDSKTGQRLGKCWLTLMILTHPRRIAAYYLTFDPPSYRSCLMVMRLCVKRYGRLPTAITVDGGPEFRSVYFEHLLALYKVRKHQRPASEPRFGSPLERLFGSLETEFLYHLLGNTQATQHPRKTTRATDPQRLAVWTLPALAERVRQWADEEYETIPHPALGMTPREAYEQSIRRDGERDHKRIPYDEVFIRSTFPTTVRGRALVQPGKGVRMNCLDYWCDEMRDKEVERTIVPVRYDPFNVTVGYARIGGRWRKCICVADELAGCSERELQLIAEELRKRNRLLYGKAQVEVTQKQLADFRRENAAKEVLLRQQRHDHETKAALFVLEGGHGAPAVLSSALTLLRTDPEEQALDKGNESASLTARRPIGDGDTLRVLRRLH
jgi:putative transposase